MILATLVEWLLERIGLVVFVLIFISQIIRGILRARKTAEPEEAKPDEMAAERRQREIQEEIRRRRAERRTGQAPAPPPLHVPPPAHPETTQMPEPFGGPLRRVLEEIEKEMRPAQPPAPPPLLPVAVERSNAELERQRHLAEELKALEEARALAQRRAAHLAASQKAEAESETGQRSAARVRLLDDLRDPSSLRRAFVLREVLGPPVGLR